MRERRDKHKAARRREAAKRAAVEQRIAETGFIDRRTLARRAGLKVPGTSRYLRAGFLVPAERVGEGRTAVMLFRPEDAERLRARRRGELHPLREARLAAGLTQAELGELAGCKNTSISGIEAGAVFPSVELGKKLAANVGRTLEEVFGEPKPCACGCRELTFATYAEHHAITAAHQVRPAKWKAVEAYAAKHGLVDAENIGEGAGCHPTSVKARARAGDLGDLALRYPGEWSPESSRPWLFKPAAVGRMRELRSEWRDRQRATAKEAGKRNGPKLRAYWRTAEGQARAEKQSRERAAPPVERKCDLCGHAQARKPAAARRNERHRWRFRCQECQKAWSTAVMRGRTILRAHPQVRANHLSPAIREAVLAIRKLGDELEHEIKAQSQARDGRPRSIGLRLVLDVLFAWGRFSDKQIAFLLGGSLDEDYVKKLRNRWNIRRPEAA